MNELPNQGAGTDPGPASDPAPPRVAAIDVGSNAIRTLAAEIPRPGEFRELESSRVPVRLGEGAFRDGVLEPRAMDAAVDALRAAALRLEALGVRHSRAVATSAVRDSRNGAAFVERVRRETGVRVEIISGAEEARLTWLATRRRVELGGRRWILVDLGGGSVEISLADADGIHRAESLPIGTVRLITEVGPAALHTPAAFRRRLEDHAVMLRGSAAILSAAAAGMIATGGNSEALVSLCGVQAEADGTRRLPVDSLREAIDLLAGLSAAERVARLGLRPDRADVILPAAIVYERLATLAGAPEILVPGVGVREGILLDLMEELDSKHAHEERLERAVEAQALEIGRRYAFDEPHARQVARLALSLFDQLREAHGLGAVERRILLAAGLLHDIGQFVSHRRHHKHSYYLISQAELPGISPREIRLVALVARYHRRAQPKKSHEGYAKLTGKDRRRVKLLASLLRLADALDRGHLQRVQEARARAHDGELRLTVAGDLGPEERAVEKKAGMFERVFGLRLHLVRAGTAHPRGASS